MTELLKAHKYVIAKVVHNKKVIKLLVQRRKWPYETFLEYREENPLPKILHKNPEWLKDFVHKLNLGEIKFITRKQKLGLQMGEKLSK